MGGSGPELQAVLSSRAPRYDIAQEYNRAQLQRILASVQRKQSGSCLLTYRSDGCEHESRRRKASHRDRGCAAGLMANNLVRRSRQSTVEESVDTPEAPGLDPGRQCCRVVKVPERYAITGRHQSICTGPCYPSISAEARVLLTQSRGLALGEVDRGDVVQSRKGRMDPPGSGSTGGPHCDPAARASGDLRE